MATVKRRDCIILTDDHLPHIGGSRLYVHKVASLLAARVALVTRRRPGARRFDAGLPYEIERAFLGGRLLPGLAALGEAADALALAHAAAALGAAGSYIAGEITPAAYAAAWLGRRRGVPYGVIVHDEPFSGAGRLEAAARRAVLAGASALVVSSSFPARRLRAILGEDAPIFTAPPGVDLETFSPGACDEGVLERFGVEPSRFVLSVGRLVDYKNFDAVIRTVAASSDGLLKVVVVGEGPGEGRLREVAAGSGLGGRAVFAGRVARADLVELYRGALAYVFPSRRGAGARQHEGIGMAALEAAACGCPVIVSTHTSATDFVEDGVTGLVFDPETPGALESALESLRSDGRLRDALARRGAERVRAGYSWQATADAFARVLDRLVGS